MSWPPDQPPASKNSPGRSPRSGNYSNFRSPFPSPRNGHEFGGPSPIKNFGWGNNSGCNSFQNDRFHYSPGGNRRGRRGHFRSRGGGHFRGSPADSTDISSYVNPAMLNDPWKELEDTLGARIIPRISLLSGPSVTSTPNSSFNASAHTLISNDDTNGQLTEESLVISSNSSSEAVSVPDQTVECDGDNTVKNKIENPDTTS